MTKQRSQTALYGELLTNEEQFTKDVSFLRLSKEEEQALVERARNGDKQAKQELVTSVLPTLSRIAKRYVVAYQWAFSHLEYLDLVQDASIAMLTYIDDALKKETPIPYLIGIGRMEIRDSCYNAMSTEQSESLDAPIGEEDDCSFHEVLSTSLLPVSPYSNETRDHTPLYQAIEQLPVLQQEVILRCYSIHEHGKESCADVNRSLGLHAQHTRAYRQERMALSVLHLKLKSSYREYATSTLLLSQNETQSHGQRHRLDAACEELQAQGQKITVRALYAVTKINTTAIMLYLRERRQQSA